MPELPEVETIARTLTPLVEGRRIVGVEVRHAGSVQVSSLPLGKLTGRTIVGAGRRGKLVLIRLVPERGAAEEPSALAVHLKMTGRLFVYPDGTEPGAHTRVVFGLEKPDGHPEQLFFDDVRKFGYLRLVSPASLQTWNFWNALGPEPLELSPADFRAVLEGRRGRIKAVLLDQTVLAGIGNIYADESLFRARIAPHSPTDRLTPRQIESLCRHLQDVLRESIEQCGSSIRDYRTARGDAGAFQNSFRVYGRAGQPCRKCGKPLATGKVAGRTTVWCEGCQR